MDFKKSDDDNEVIRKVGLVGNGLLAEVLVACDIDLQQNTLHMKLMRTRIISKIEAYDFPSKIKGQVVVKILSHEQRLESIIENTFQFDENTTHYGAVVDQFPPGLSTLSAENLRLVQEVFDNIEPYNPEDFEKKRNKWTNSKLITNPVLIAIVTIYRFKYDEVMRFAGPAIKAQFPFIVFDDGPEEEKFKLAFGKALDRMKAPLIWMPKKRLVESIPYKHAFITDPALLTQFDQLVQDFRPDEADEKRRYKHLYEGRNLIWTADENGDFPPVPDRDAAVAALRLPIAEVALASLRARQALRAPQPRRQPQPPTPPPPPPQQPASVTNRDDVLPTVVPTNNNVASHDPMTVDSS